MEAFDARALAARPMNNRAFIDFSRISKWFIVAGLHYHTEGTLSQAPYHLIDRYRV
jgi:hypothetical protein